MKNLSVTKVSRKPDEDSTTGSLPHPNTFPTFVVDFQYDGKPFTMDMALEMGGRDADFLDPDGIDPDDMADISEELMNAIYGSKPYADAAAALEQAPASFWTS